jgi:hypothetical protein
LQHQALRTFDSPPHYIGMRRFAEALPKARQAILSDRAVSTFEQAALKVA